MCKKFIIFNFRGWSQPQRLNVDHALYVTLCTSTVSTATMDALRSLEKERRYVYLTQNGTTKSLCISS